MVRNLTRDNMSESGRVSCSFTLRQLAEGATTQRCPHAARSFDFAADYRFDNALWLRDFQDVYHKMLNHGYPYHPDDHLTKCGPSRICIYES